LVELTPVRKCQRKVYCRLQEVFAGFLDHADHHLGRLFDALDAMGVRNNTLIMVVSDNGASQEGLQNGTLNTDRYRNYFPDTVEEMLDKLDDAGGPSTDPHYPMGWAMDGSAPLKRWKQDTHAGGNTDPIIVSWPAKIKDRGAIRNQYHHIVDVVPTILDVIGLPAPVSVNGVKQMPLHGVSMAYSFTDGTSILHPLAAPQLLGREHTITAHVDLPASGAEGVLACSGGEFGGWVLFLKDGKFHYVHNYLKLDEKHVASPGPAPSGKHTLAAHFTPTETHLKPDYTIGDVSISVDGEMVGELKGIKVAGQYSAMTGYGLLIGRNTVELK